MSHCWCRCEAGVGQCGPKVPKLKTLFNAHRANLSDASLRRADQMAELQVMWDEIGEEKAAKTEEIDAKVAKVVDTTFRSAIAEAAARREELSRAVHVLEKRLHDILGPDAMLAIAPRDWGLRQRYKANRARLQELESATTPGDLSWVGSLMVLAELQRRMSTLRGHRLPASSASTATPHGSSAKSARVPRQERAEFAGRLKVASPLSNGYESAASDSTTRSFRRAKSTSSNQGSAQGGLDGYSRARVRAPPSVRGEDGSAALWQPPLVSPRGLPAKLPLTPKSDAGTPHGSRLFQRLESFSAALRLDDEELSDGFSDRAESVGAPLSEGGAPSMARSDIVAQVVQGMRRGATSAFLPLNGDAPLDRGVLEDPQPQSQRDEWINGSPAGSPRARVPMASNANSAWLPGAPKRNITEACAAEPRSSAPSLAARTETGAGQSASIDHLDEVFELPTFVRPAGGQATKLKGSHEGSECAQGAKAGTWWHGLGLGGQSSQSPAALPEALACTVEASSTGPLPTVRGREGLALASDCARPRHGAGQPSAKPHGQESSPPLLALLPALFRQPAPRALSRRGPHALGFSRRSASGPGLGTMGSKHGAGGVSGRPLGPRPSLSLLQVLADPSGADSAAAMVEDALAALAQPQLASNHSRVFAKPLRLLNGVRSNAPNAVLQRATWGRGGMPGGRGLPNAMAGGASSARLSSESVHSANLAAPHGLYSNGPKPLQARLQMGKSFAPPPPPPSGVGSKTPAFPTSASLKGPPRPPPLPPPPPTPGSLAKGAFTSGSFSMLRSHSGGTQLRRSATMGQLYRGLRTRMEMGGRDLASVQGGPSSSLQAGSAVACGKTWSRESNRGSQASSGADGLADALLEISRKSAYFQRVEADVVLHAPAIWQAKAELEAFASRDPEEMLRFHAHMEKMLEPLSDESQVLHRFEGFPSKKLETLRLAASYHGRLSGLLRQLDGWALPSDPSLAPAEEMARAERFLEKVRKEVEALERSREEESRRFLQHSVPFDFSLIEAAKCSAVQLSSRVLHYAAKESAKLRQSLMEQGTAPTLHETARLKAGLALLWRSFQFAFRVYTFAGGQDDAAEQASLAVVSEMEKFPEACWR